MNPVKILGSVRRGIYGLQSGLTLLVYRLFFPNAVFGRGCRMYGVPRLSVHREGALSVGTECTLVSTSTFNPIGVYMPCGITVQRKASLRIGHGCGLSGVSIYCAESISLGNEVLCGAGVCIWDTDFHPIEMPHRATHKTGAASRPVIIEDNVFIGARTIILKGTRIGRNSVIGAGSVVSGKQIGDNEIWAGNPARFIRKIKMQDGEAVTDRQELLKIAI